MSWSMTKKQRLAHFYHFGLFSAQFQDRHAILMRYFCLIVKIETTGQEKRWISKFCVFWSWFRYLGRRIEAGFGQMFPHLRANRRTTSSESVSLYGYISRQSIVQILPALNRLESQTQRATSFCTKILESGKALKTWMVQKCSNTLAEGRGLVAIGVCGFHKWIKQWGFGKIFP